MKAAITSAIALTALIAFASPAKAQECPPIPQTGEGDFFPQFCGFVWNDADGDGAQDVSETGIDVVKVTLFVKEGSSWIYVDDVTTSGGGFYVFKPEEGAYPEGEYKVAATVPSGTTPSCLSSDPTCVSYGTPNTLDNDGASDPDGSAAFICLGGTTGCVSSQESDFGFTTKSVPVSPGTGTPGYWKNHPDSWAQAGGQVLIGTIPYTWQQAREYMGKVSKDKTISLFSQLVAAKLNVAIGNDNSCIKDQIEAADAWLFSHPVGGIPTVTASSTAWQQISQVHNDLDDYNNGRLCAPHRN